MGKRADMQKIGERSYSLDVRGHVCPYPELLTLRALQSLSSGDVLEVILDNPPSVRDIPIAIEKRGCGKPEILSMDRGSWKIIVRIPE